MNKSTKHLTLTACALAATLFLGACGGGASTDTIPPTVAITSAATAGAGVTFTFTFSEDVGTSFTADDVAVTGGTKASTLTKVSATVYTLVVTPDAPDADLIATLVAGKFSDVANNANVAAGANTFAATAAPVPPTRAAADVVSIYSDSYTQVAGFNPRPDWGQPTAAAEVTIGGNKAEKYSGLTYEGIEFSSVNVSTMTTLHIDVWTPDLTALKISVISPGKENAVTVNPTKYGWNSFDIDMAQYTVADKTAVFQLKLEAGAPSPANVYVDNIYFYKAAAACSTTVLDCAPTTAIPSGSVIVYSDASTTAGFVPRPDWGQSVAETEVTVAGNKSLKYTFQGGGFGAVGAYEGITWETSPLDVSGKGKLHLDLWSADLTSLKISLIGGGENAVTQSISPGIWNSVDIDLSQFPGATNKAAVIQLKLESAAAGSVNVDNIYFWGTASTGGGGTTTPAVMGAGGAQTMTMYPATGAPACGAPSQPLCLFNSGDYIFAGDYKGGLEAATGRFATFVGSQTVAPAVFPSALAGGEVGHYNDPAMDTSSQKLASEGWVTGTSSDAAGSPNFFYQFVLTKPASAFASSYMGVYVNAPQNGTVDVSARSNMKLRIWGPGQMYQNSIPTSSSVSLNPVLNLTLAGPKTTGCASGSGGSEITKNLTANSTIGGAAEYTVSLAGWTLATGCGADASAADVLKHVARVVVNIPGTSFNFTNANGIAGVDATAYVTGVNIGAISFK